MGERLSTDRAVMELATLIGDRVAILHRPVGPIEGSLSGSDIDCAVDSIHPQWPLRAQGWRLLQSLHYDLCGWFWVLERDGELVAFDTIDDPHGLGRDGIRTNAFLGGSWVVEPSAASRAAYLTVKRARKRSTSPSEWQRIGRLANEDPASFAAALSLAAGPAVAGLLHDAALAGEPPDAATMAEANLLRHRRRFASPTRAARGVASGFRRYAHRILQPSGLTVLVVGPDGAGKSTLAGDIVAACDGLFKRFDHQHWRPGMLPRPGSFLARPESDPSEPHARPPYGRLASSALLAYYWTDFFLGALTRESLFRVRSGLIVRERGWWDMAVDPHRYRLEVSRRLVSMGAALLPRPDLVFVLEAPVEELAGRKAELGDAEIARQSAAWREVLPSNVARRYLDMTQPPEQVKQRARDAICQLLERRAVGRLGSGWVALPSGQPRWWLPRGPARVAASGLAIYQPVTPRGLAVWRVARTGARLGAAGLRSRGSAPPRRVRELLASAIPPRGTIAVARGTHAGRYTALIIDRSGVARSFAKVDLGPGDGAALEAEAKAMGELGPYLPSALRVPEVRSAEPRVLVLESLTWRPRPDAWVMEPELAGAVGAFFRAGRREGAEGPEGPAHGDLAPWNVLAVDGGWALVDWELARRYAPAFHDIYHFFVQSHTLLRAPSADELIRGVRGGAGMVGRAIAAYAGAAGVPVDGAYDALIAYLRTTRPDPASPDPATAGAIARRDALLARLVR